MFLTAIQDDPMAILTAAQEAAKGGHWSIFVSLVIMGLVYVVTKVPFIDSKLKGGRKIWVAAVAGVLLAVATTAFTTGDWVRAIFDGLSAGLGATGLFELVRRSAAKQPIDANNDGVLDSLPPAAPKQ